LVELAVAAVVGARVDELVLDVVVEIVVCVVAVDEVEVVEVVVVVVAGLATAICSMDVPIG
jgi:hypothetical protein